MKSFYATINSGIELRRQDGYEFLHKMATKLQNKMSGSNNSIFEILVPENIGLDTKIKFLSRLINNIWYF